MHLSEFINNAYNGAIKSLSHGASAIYIFNINLLSGFKCDFSIAYKIILNNCKPLIYIIIYDTFTKF